MSAEVSPHGAAVRYRPMAWDDLDDIVTTFDDTWGDHGSAQEMALSRRISRHFVLHYLEPSTRVEVAQHDGRFMGVTFSRVPGAPLAFERAGQALIAADAALDAGETGRAALAGLRYWHEVELRLEDECGVDNDTYGEVELFLVASSARGRGIGAGLWNRAMADFDRRGVRRCFLHTDSTCDVGFYDHHRMRRVCARWSADHPEDVARAGHRLDDLFIYAAEPRAMVHDLGENTAPETVGVGAGARVTPSAASRSRGRR